MDDQTVRTICYLSRLKLDDEKSKKILSDLDTIIEMIDSLSSSNTENISPLYKDLTSQRLKIKRLMINLHLIEEDICITVELKNWQWESDQKE